MEKSSALLDADALSALTKGKNLLAFSGGVDSTALFFLLLEAEIAFDMVIVDYAKRESSHAEVEYAKQLANAYHKTIFTQAILLDDANFESNARVARYGYFESLVKEHHYDNLITAHQLNDRLEWFLMQFTKGAGTVELLGFFACEMRENYRLIRPLINVSKERLLAYLKENQHLYFEDESNQELKYKRNFFRHTFSDTLLADHEAGILKSFTYLEADRHALFAPVILAQNQELTILKRRQDETHDIRAIDKIVKKLGYMLSAKERAEIMRQKESVVSHAIAVCITEEKIFIAPFIQAVMPKLFKEACRKAKIPPKIRGYLMIKNITPASMQNAD